MLFDIPNSEHSIIKVIGVGGGGGNAVAHMYRQGIKGVDFAISNTDNQAMENSPVDVRIQLGPQLTDGRGAGTKPEVGKEACIESIDDVRQFIDSGTKMLFITAGMGGGTGTGAAPIIAKAAKEEGILTVGVVTIPFKFEGLKRQRQALEGLEQLKANVDAILVISNDKMREIHGNLAISEAFAQADEILTTAVKGIAEIITVPGYVNVDFEDVNTVMRRSGVAIMGNAMAEGEDRARKAISDALNSPLLEDNDIRGARHILLNITSGTKEVTMDEIGEITDYVQEEAGYGTDLVWGNCRDEALGEKISITLIATGFAEGNAKRVQPQVEEKIIVSLDDGEMSIREEFISTGMAEGDKTHMVDFDNDDVKKTIETLGVRHGAFDLDDIEEVHPRRDPRIERTTATAQHKNNEIEAARRAYLRNQATKPLDNPQIISEMESVPAYKRRKVSLDDTREHNDGISGFKVSVDDDAPIISSNNSFLHDNID
jgi:cell division protein FtsZ